MACSSRPRPSRLRPPSCTPSRPPQRSGLHLLEERPRWPLDPECRTCWRASTCSPCSTCATGRAGRPPCSRPSPPSRLRSSPCASSRAFWPPNTRRATSVSSCPLCLQPHRLIEIWHVVLSDLRPSSSSASPGKQKHLTRRRRRPRPRPDRLGQQLGLLPRTQSQGRGSSHAPARLGLGLGLGLASLPALLASIAARHTTRLPITCATFSSPNAAATCANA